MPHGRVQVGGKEIEDAADSARRARSMYRAKHEVAGLGRVQARLEGHTIAHFAHQDHVRVLANHVLESRLPIAYVQADLALVDHRLLIGEQIFDRILDGNDVDPLALIDEIEHGGNGGALPAPGHAGQNDHALVEVAELLDRSREAELLEGGNCGIHSPSNDAQVAALLKDVDAKTAFVLADDMSEVGPACLFHDLAMVLGNDGVQQPLHFLFAERFHFHLANDAAQPHHGG